MRSSVLSSRSGLRREHFAVDESDDERARLVMHDLRRQPRRMGRERGRALIEAHHLMAGNVVADTHDEALAAMAHEEVGVGEAAAERLGGDGAAQKERPSATLRGSFWGKDATAGEGLFHHRGLEDAHHAGAAGLS